MGSPPLAVDLAGWPGVVLRVAADGEVLASNGRLDAALGVGVVGRAMPALLERDASLEKWRRLTSETAPGGTWELTFCTEARVLAPGAYSALPAGDGGGWWLVEHPPAPRLAELASEVAVVNAELSTAQRSLVIERSRLRRALAEVERSNRSLDEFAHVVSHDLKAPLRGIREHAEVALDPASPGGGEERAARLGRVRDLAARMRAMIDAALEYARAGRAAGRAETIDSGELLREVVEFLSPPGDVSIRLAPGLPTLEAERVPFEQVFRNLLSNAIAYRREAGARIEVTAAEAGDCWEFVVADNGPGIPPGQQERIWRLFHTSRPGEGTGLGLALVRRIVESQHGSVAVRSVPGDGATFHVRWPKRPASSTVRQRAGDAAAG